MEWVSAIQYCLDLKVVSNGIILEDWRLPALPEFISILRFGAPPLLDTSVFPDGIVTYWTTTYAAQDVAFGSSRLDSRWTISTDGTHLEETIIARTSLFELRNEHHVRCVRTTRD